MADATIAAKVQKGTPDTLTVASGGKIVFDSGGDITGGGLAISPTHVRWEPTSVDTPFFVATRAWRVLGITARVEVAGTNGSAVTAVVKKAASGTAITAGTALHTGSIDLKGTAATNQALTLSSTSSDLDIAAGDCIGIDYTGTLTSAVGTVTVMLAPA